ncbi:MAG: hypothetical protein JWL73_3986 [Actinomycetia bacterium]|nr:hypothetical protein [Actinomycetes bacterium]
MTTAHDDQTGTGAGPTSRVPGTALRDGAQIPGGDRPRRAGMVSELQVPMDSVARALHRLSLHRLTPPGAPTPPAQHLIRRARSLASELQTVIEELIDCSSPESGLGATATGRKHQQRLRTLDVLIRVRDEMAGHLDPEQVTIECAEDLMVTTHATEVREILTDVLSDVARLGDQVRVQLIGRNLGLAVAIDVVWTDPNARAAIDGSGSDDELGLPLARAIAESLAGSVEVQTAGNRIVAHVVIPQQRVQDRA